MKLKAFELALVFALILAFVYSCITSARADELSEKLIRIHVVAASDTDFEQNLKLKVRDSVLKYLEPRLNRAKSRDDAISIINEEKKAVENAARETIIKSGKDHSVSVTLEEENFPTRDYGSFSLPSGKYLTLRVTIGEGEGHNWWCVLFPNVCFAGQLKRDNGAELGLTEDEMSLITRDSEETVIQFRVIEIISKLKMLLGF